MLLDVNVIQLQGARPRQEDNYLVRESNRGLIMLVADGLGGHERGDEASRVACLAAYEAFEKAFVKPCSARSALRKTFVAAHKAVQKIPSAHRRSPASTLVGGFLSPADRQFYGASIGDSLAFLFRDGRVSRLFRPQVEGDAIIHALGLDVGDSNGSAIDLLEPINLQPDDRLLLASDGISELSDDQIDMALTLPSARAAADRMARLLIDMRQEHQDNVTLVVVKVA